MSQTKQQEQGAAQAKPKARKDWELFWRIIAGLMLLVIAWVVWVLYQITPRSVVTPLAYQTQVRPIGTTPDGAAATVPAVPPAAFDQAQPAAISGAHQVSGETQAAAQEHAQEQKIKGDGLRLATELSTPPPATGAAGKDRP